MKPCSINGIFRAFLISVEKFFLQYDRTSPDGPSGKTQRPPQIPLLGRRSSSTAPWCRSTSQVVRRSGSGLRLRADGNSAIRSSRKATQSPATGQRSQAGRVRVHTVAPRSISAWV